MIRTLVFVYIVASLASLAFTQEFPEDSLLKSTSSYIPRRCNPCDVAVACTQFALPPNPTTAQCKAALSAIMYQPPSVGASFLECKSRAIFDPVFQWFVDGPVVTAQQFALNLGVAVEVVDAAGFIVAYVNADGSVDASAIGKPTPFYDTTRARSTNIPTYLRFEDSGRMYYTVNIYNWDAQMYTVALVVPISSVPVV